MDCNNIFCKLFVILLDNRYYQLLFSLKYHNLEFLAVYCEKEKAD